MKLESNRISSPVVVGKSRWACKFGNLNDGSTVAKIMIAPLLICFNLYDLAVIFAEDATTSIQCTFQKVVKIGFDWGKNHGPCSFGEDLSEPPLTLEVILWTGKQKPHSDTHWHINTKQGAIRMSGLRKLVKYCIPDFVLHIGSRLISVTFASTTRAPLSARFWNGSPKINNSMINTIMARLNPKTYDRSKEDLLHYSFDSPSRRCARDYND